MYRKQTTLRMEKELYNKLAQMARLNMRSVSDMIRLILMENVDKYDGWQTQEQIARGQNYEVR